jgi:LAO/AO transport system kinase
VVLVPGMGDDVQAIKAGIMEIADIFVINKADQAGADRVERELQGMLSLANGKVPAIVRTVATNGTGIAELLAAVESATGRVHAARYGAASIDHLGIAVPALDAAIGFYEALGLKVEHRETVAAEKVNVAMLPAGDSRIELLEASAADSPIAKFIERRGAGLHHVALRVPDLQAAVERLKASGARLLNEPRQGAGGHTYVFVHPASAGGVLLELIQGEELH